MKMVLIDNRDAVTPDIVHGRIAAGQATIGARAPNAAATPATAPRSLSSASAKLRAALDYLGDKLSTHPASRFTPPKSPLLDEWLATRRVAQRESPPTADSPIKVVNVAARQVA